MNDTKWLAPVIAGIVGIAALAIVLKLVIAPSTPTVPQQQAAPQAGGGQPRMDADMERQIKTLRQIVAANPGNRDAWVKLGNDLFDSNRPAESIEAYGKALELNPRDPNVLTDQGVMYRATGQYDRAIANFKKAIEIDPRHTIARFNWGVVLFNDVRDLAAAKEVFLQYQAMGGGEHSADVQGLLAEIEKEQASHGASTK